MDPMGFTTIAMIKEHGNSCERIHEEGRTSKRNFKGWSGGVGCFLFEWRRYIAFRSEKDKLGSAPVHFGWNNEFHSLFEEESTAKLDISTGQRLLRFMWEGGCNVIMSATLYWPICRTQSHRKRLRLHNMLYLDEQQAIRDHRWAFKAVLEAWHIVNRNLVDKLISTITNRVIRSLTSKKLYRLLTLLFLFRFLVANHASSTIYFLLVCLF